MTKRKNYHREIIPSISLYGVFVLTTAIIYQLYQLPIAFFFDQLLFLTVIWLGYQLVHYRAFRKKQKMLRAILQQEHILDTISLLPKATTSIEADYQKIIQQLVTENHLQLHTIEQQNQTFIEDFGLWLHQIKTPVAALDLMNQAGQLEETKVSIELFKINEYLQLLLNYIRQTTTQDFLFESISLQAVINESLKKYAFFFSYKELRLVMKQLNVTVLTDKKWFTFLFEQLLFNALKYTKTGEIAIIWKNGELIIADTGIGIRPEDVPRVFEKGYTGYNGRQEQRASGLGLYLSKKVSEQLAIQLTLESQVNVGTKVVLRFPEAIPYVD